MPSNKNQHFVPKCHFKPFTLNNDGHSINIYNLRRDAVIENAPVKNQCSGDYFYGQDLIIEKGLQQLEGEYSNLLNKIIVPGKTLTNADCDTIRSFWLLQYMRTEAASQREVEQAEEIDEFVGSENHRFGSSIKDAVQAAMHRFEEMRFSLGDMKMCIFRNKSKVSFITSDDPAILANKWYAIDKRCAKLTHGLSSSGALFILPLGPRLLCLAYDSDVYSIPNKNGWSDLHRDADVLSLNEHQYLNCRANIYFQNWADAAVHQKTAQELIRFRPAVRHKLNLAVLETEDFDGRTFRQVDIATARESRHVLMHMQNIRPNPVSWPRQISLRHGGRAYYSGGAGYLRALQHKGIEAETGIKIRTS